MNRFEDVWVLIEQERSLGVYAEEEQSIDSINHFFAQIALKTHDEVLNFRHDWVKFGPFEIVDSGVVICFFVVFF